MINEIINSIRTQRKNPRNTVYTVKLSKKEIEYIRDKAKSLGMSQADMIVWAARDFKMNDREIA